MSNGGDMEHLHFPKAKESFSLKMKNYKLKWL